MITFTEQATKKVTQMMARRGIGIGIRLGVKTTGCSGLAYVLEYVDQSKLEDIEFDASGTRIFVDPKSLVYLSGMNVDYLRTGLNEGFKFSNPNERDRCGCGESFRI